jgi:hypothetical protein
VGTKLPIRTAMSIPLISNASSYVQSVLGTALQGIGSTSKTTSSNLSGIGATPSQRDSSQLSPFAQVLSQLQQLQQSDPAKYQQVTQQIGANLQQASDSAKAAGDTTAATQLGQLSNDFTDASKSGQLPNIQDLAQAIGGGGGGHHHHHHRVASSDSDNGSSTSGASASTSIASSTNGSSSSSNASQLAQLLAAFESGGAQNDSYNPASIILNTLSGAGISASSS